MELGRGQDNFWIDDKQEGSESSTTVNNVADYAGAKVVESAVADAVVDCMGQE